MLSVSAEQKIQPDTLRPEMDAINLELMTLAAALPLTQPALAAAGATTLDKQALRALLDQLDAMLGQSDTAATALFEEHTAALCVALGAQGEQLGREIGRFDFEAARHTLRAAQSKFEVEGRK